MPDDQRLVRVKTSLGPGKFLMRNLSAVEQLGQPFEIQLTLDSDDQKIDYKKILGDHLTVEIDISESDHRYFDGIVTRFAYVGLQDFKARYLVTLHPWFWLLKKHAQCKIFQQKDVPTIIKDVFRAANFDDFDDKLQRSDYLTLDYCVQYRESDFDFVSRLMEQEGIYYYFEHSDGRHKLVLCDGTGSHQKFNGTYHDIQLMRTDDGSQTGTAWDWSLTQELQSGQYTHTDYDLEKPNADLKKSKSITQGHKEDSFEIYDYPGKYTETSDGTTYANMRMEEQAAKFERGHGKTRTRWLSVGYLIELKESTHEEHNAEYVVVSTHSTMTTENTSGGSQGLLSEFEALATSYTYRSPRVTAKPFIRGPQTAMVVGKSGEEIWTDKYGRVKVQFHWDRDGQNNESSSCWIRCSQMWASKNWGGQFVPRIGQEVVVHFLEGDPDQPLITGAVYNASSMPPYDLPANATQSGVKTNSSKGGGGSNEIRFEDKKGSEDFYMHAQKDMDVEIINDHNHTVKQGNQTIEITEGDRTLTVKQGKETHEVSQGNRSVKVGQGTQSHEVFGDTSLKISTGNYTLELSAGSASIKAPQAITVESQMSIELKVGGNSVKIDQTGVTIQGLMVKLNGQVQTDIQGLMTDVKASAMLQLQGGITMIG
jgi:type VI secretion system secreted protein VgrG